VWGENTSDATGALLTLTLEEPDRLWMERLLLDLVDRASDPQVKALAVICLGHLARIHRAITAETVIVRLQALKSDRELGSRARNALEDIEIFVERN